MLVDSSGGLPVAPLVDVVLLLLIFYMLVSRYLPPTLAVSLPEASTAQHEHSPSVSLSIDRQGRLSMDGRLTEWDDLALLLAEYEPSTRLRIAADKAVDYEYVVRALDAAAQAGLVRIALETVTGR
jgi:biopolymer transport protein ExbD